ncbi:uncharacterized protein SAPINGB_P003173 [Magnusiomyces paraingens]|uniref:Uncharacterized protein n=1 Tax=Magnusiomyces paraingens TaxID=2606893 RepID=A0A5E8BL88_9ASCO|nr:uncharacterized protein SAPINGB_P003173 [Saprochaete ingens]VVT51669.1 unnamed protein product [Saprochaete ingens]
MTVSALFVVKNWSIASDSTLNNILGCKKWGSVLFQAKSSLISQLDGSDKDVRTSSIVTDTQNTFIKPFEQESSGLTFVPTRRIQTRSLTKSTNSYDVDHKVYVVPSSPVAIQSPFQSKELLQETESENIVVNSILDRDNHLYLTVQANIQKKLDEIIASKFSFKNRIEKSKQNDIIKRKTPDQSQSPIKKRPRSRSASLAAVPVTNKPLSFNSTSSNSSEEECDEINSEELEEEEEHLLFNQAQESGTVNDNLDTSTQRFQNTWEAIISKYSDSKYAESGDVVDLLTGDVVEDNGHLRSLPENQKSLWTYYGEPEEEEYDPGDDVDEVDLFKITSEGLLGYSRSIFRNNQDESAQDNIQEDLVNEIQGATVKENESDFEEITFSQFERTQKTSILATKRPDHITKLITDKTFVSLLKEKQALRYETRNPKYDLQTLDGLRSLPRDPFEKFMETDQLEQELNNLTLGSRNEPFLKTCNEFLHASFTRADQISCEIKKLNAGPLDDNEWLPEVLETTAAAIMTPIQIS